MKISFGGHDFIADCSGALYWPARGTLIVADIHLEKGSSFGTRSGQLLPPYDSMATLENLVRLSQQYGATRIITLGDNVHDRDGWSRLPAVAQAILANLALETELLFLYGNHDQQQRPPFGRVMPALLEQGIYMMHEPELEVVPTMAGHLHPCVSLPGYSRTRCFFVTERMMILPAFGAYTGSLDVADPVFAPYTADGADLYLCGTEAVHHLPLVAYQAAFSARVAG